MLTSSHLEALFKWQSGKLPGVNICVHEAVDRDGFNIVAQFGDETGRDAIVWHTFVSSIEVEDYNAYATTESGKRVGRHVLAFRNLYRAGIDEGRARERKDEMTRLHDIRETALRMRTARAYAAGWNAVAASLKDQERPPCPAK